MQFDLISILHLMYPRTEMFPCDLESKLRALRHHSGCLNSDMSAYYNNQ